MGEGEYNLNALTAVEITDSYLGLDKNIRKCQNEEPYQNCTSRKYFDTLLGKCGCLPFYMNLQNNKKVHNQECKMFYASSTEGINFRNSHVPQSRWTALKV